MPTSGPLASWILSQAGRARPIEPAGSRRARRELRRARARGATRASPRSRRALRRRAAGPAPAERSAGPVAPERFGLLQALLAYLLMRCGDEPSADIPAEELSERFHIPVEHLDEHLQLLNLVNFGGGCYALYASLDGGVVHVEKELWGDTFRRPPRLTPLEARAIRLALEFVGPMIAADAHTPLDRVRQKARGDVRPVRARRRRGRRAVGRDGRGAPRPHALRGDARAPPRRVRVPEARRDRGLDAYGRALLRSAESCRTGT